VSSDWDQWSVVGGQLSVKVKRPTQPKSGRMGHPPQDCLLVGESPGEPPATLLKSFRESKKCGVGHPASESKRSLQVGNRKTVKRCLKGKDRHAVDFQSVFLYGANSHKGLDPTEAEVYRLKVLKILNR